MLHPRSSVKTTHGTCAGGLDHLAVRGGLALGAPVCARSAPSMPHVGAADLAPGVGSPPPHCCGWARMLVVGRTREGAPCRPVGVADELSRRRLSLGEPNALPV